jgi:hypothetical protein
MKVLESSYLDIFHEKTIMSLQKSQTEMNNSLMIASLPLSNKLF